MSINRATQNWPRKEVREVGGCGDQHLKSLVPCGYCQTMICEFCCAVDEIDEPICHVCLVQRVQR